MIFVPKNLQIIASILKQAGHSCYFVGGFVRDGIMGQLSDDVDVCTDAIPDRLVKIFAAYRPKALYPYGISFKIDNFNIEISTMRHEPDNHKGRHPSTICYINDVALDAMRRDFTFNAIYYSLEAGTLDPVHGIQDLKEGIIKSIGDPVNKMSEDPIRILRAFVFQSRFGFEIDPKLLNAALNHLELVSKISDYQLTQLLLKLLDGNYLSKLIANTPEVMLSFVPDLKNVMHLIIEGPKTKLSALNYISNIIENSMGSLETKVLGLLHLLGLSNPIDNDILRLTDLDNMCSNGVVKKYLEKFQFSKKNQKELLRVLDGIGQQTFDSTLAMQRFIYEYGESVSKLRYSFQEALDKSLGNLIEEDSYRNRYFEVISLNVPTDIKGLNIKAQDLVENGIPFEHTKACLHYALVRYLSGSLLNVKEDLISYCKEVYNDIYQI